MRRWARVLLCILAWDFTLSVVSVSMDWIFVYCVDIWRLRERTEHLDIFLFPPITQCCSISDVLFTGGREVSDFSVLKYYYLNINYSVNILNECLRILIDCSQLSKTYYNVLFGSSNQDRHSRRRLYQRTFRLNASCMTIWGGRTKQLHIFCRVTGFTSEFLERNNQTTH